MDPVGAMEERVVTERIRRKLEEVNAAAQQHLAGVQDHVNFTMQVRRSPSSGCRPPEGGSGKGGSELRAAAGLGAASDWWSIVCILGVWWRFACSVMGNRRGVEEGANLASCAWC